MIHLAYLDAGSGSLIVQAVVGGVAGRPSPPSSTGAGWSTGSAGSPPTAAEQGPPPMAVPDTGIRVEPGSFRDPANRVFHAGDEVLRGLGPDGARDWRALSGSPFFTSCSPRARSAAPSRST